MKKDILKIGYGKWTGYEPLYLAQKTGIFKQNNASIELIKDDNEKVIIEKLKSGEIHGAPMTLDMMFVLSESGFPIKAPIILDISVGGDMIIGRKGIDNIQNLKGKKIGLEKLHIYEYVLVRALSESHINLNDITIVNIPYGGYANALKNKEVDAVVAYNPDATALLQEGYEVLFSSKDIPSSVIDVIIFPTNIYSDNIENIANLAQSWFDALRYIKLHHKESMRIMAENEEISEYEFNIAFEDISIPDLEQNLALFSLESEKNIFKISDITLDFLMKKKMIKNKIDSSEIFDPAILKLIK